MTTTTNERRISLEQAFSDTHKDAFGTRPHYDLSDWTDDELCEAIDSHVAYWQEEEAAQKEWELQCRYEREAEIQHLMLQFGAQDRATAERWYAQARGC